CARDAEVRFPLTRKKKQEGRFVFMKPEQRKWILQHRKDSRVKEMLLNDEKVKAALYTPESLEIAKALDLTDAERLKLIMFPREAHKHFLPYIVSIASGQKKTKKPVECRV